MTSIPRQPPSESSDIFSLSDQVLSDRLQFVREIGFGNWGSVWLCRPKYKSASRSADEPNKVHDVKVAVKLVHRTDSSTTTARVRSLWNEMKIVRSFKDNPHPSIIPFHSFVITPSYALITMAYLPTLIPVEVDESKAKHWFHSLLSGVEFLHQRGVVHNDIKPANILLNERRVPVFVDFGFAEKYDTKSSKAFYSNLMYGTPEYLSPERARGIPHDTRKSDLWSLGITFFEILIGRTPFEYAEGGEFCTQEDMEQYWVRTLRGKWVGTWKMSKGIEKLLKRMITPKADLRCDATDAMADAYWDGSIESVSHKRSVSDSHTSSPSVIFGKEVSKLVDASLPWSPRSTSKKRDKENTIPTHRGKEHKEPKSIFSSVSHSRPKPNPVTTPRPPIQSRNRHAILPLENLSSFKASPPTLPKSPEVLGRYPNETSDPSGIFVSLNSTASSRRPLGGARQPLSAVSQNLPLAPTEARTTPKNKGRNAGNRQGGVFMDLTGLNNHSEGRPAMVKEKPKPLPKVKEKEEPDVSGKEPDSVRKRVIEWERERERLREMERLEEFAKEQDEEQGNASFVTTSFTETEENIQVAEVAVRASAQIVPVAPSFLDLSNTQIDNVPYSANESGLSAFKQSLKMSIDKGIRIVKSSTIAGRAAPSRSLSIDDIDEPEWNIHFSEQQSWEVVPDAESPLSGVHQAARNERIAEDARMDRMSLWMRNVDKVVEDARQKFDSASAGVPQPPLPIPPASRSSSQNHTTQSSRLPRKALRASQIFSNQNASSMSALSQVAVPSVDKNLPALPSDGVAGILTTSTPSRPRRATVTTRSLEPLKKVSFDIDTGSPSKRKEKCRSQGNLLRPIETIDRLEFELQKEAMPPTSPRLSAVFDKSLFIAQPIGHAEDESSENDVTTHMRSRSLDINHLTSSLGPVESHPPRKSDGSPPVVLDTPNKRRIEGVYDRFLMATTGVKKVGRGNQSDNLGHVQNRPNTLPSAQHQNNHRLFNAARPMPPSMSNEDMKFPRAVEDFGLEARETSANVSHYKDDSSNTVALVRRALKAVVTGKTVTKQL